MCSGARGKLWCGGTAADIPVFVILFILLITAANNHSIIDQSARYCLKTC